MRPDTIEALSFKIIEELAGPHDFSDSQWMIVRRMIHTSADFEYLHSVRFHPDAIQKGVEAICWGKPIVTDTQMARTGIRKKDLDVYGVQVHCLIGAPEVQKVAEQNGLTRAHAAVEAAASLMEGGIYVVGNAPTALLHLVHLIRGYRAWPSMVIGLPVGFVNAAESKAALIETGHPYITNTGRKGGSNVAAAVVNALVKIAACRS